MERPWTFKEAGRPEKVYLEGEYPLVNFLTRLTLVKQRSNRPCDFSRAGTQGGRRARKRFFCNARSKERKPRRSTILVYLRTLRMPNAAIADGRPIHGRVEGFGTVISVSALDTLRGHMLFARVTDGTRWFRHAPARTLRPVRADRHPRADRLVRMPCRQKPPTVRRCKKATTQSMQSFRWRTIFQRRWIHRSRRQPRARQGVGLLKRRPRGLLRGQRAGRRAAFSGIWRSGPGASLSPTGRSTAAIFSSGTNRRAASATGRSCLTNDSAP